ncbi:uncharacterized protein [Diadema setosum]|uniref:uncharacterized protein n=1 Tax=Diadema setosum TaxID=31175 RepID=UPI003B3BD6CA
MSCVRERLRIRGLSHAPSEIIMRSWRQSTQRCYNSAYRRWRRFCCTWKSDPLCSDVSIVLNFLAEEFHAGAAYSTLNSLRSSLSSFLLPCDGHPVGSHPLVTRFMRGVFNSRPPRPRYNSTWDVAVVLNYLRTLSPNDKISLAQLSHKLVMLIALVPSQRAHTIAYIVPHDSSVSRSSVTFSVNHITKTSRPGKLATAIQLSAYPEDDRICVLQTLREYLRRTASFRSGNRYLVLSVNRPHRNVSPQTISRWLKGVLQSAGIDTATYKGHSTRAASTSAALRGGTDIDTILSTAGWSSARTFARFYQKPIELKKKSLDISSLE